MNHRDFQIIDSEIFQAAVISAFEFAYVQGKEDAMEGVHIDANLLAQLYLQEHSSFKLSSNSNSLFIKPVLANVSSAK